MNVTTMFSSTALDDSALWEYWVKHYSTKLLRHCREWPHGRGTEQLPAIQAFRIAWTERLVDHTRNHCGLKLAIIIGYGSAVW